MRLPDGLTLSPGRLQNGAALLALVGLLLLYRGTARPVRVIVDGETLTLSTHARNVTSVLRDAGIALYAGDRVFPDPAAGIPESGVILVQRARPVVIELEEGTQVLRTAEREPSNVLAEAGLAIYPGDRLWVDGIPADQAPHGAAPQRLRLVRASTIRIEVGDLLRTANTAAGSLAQALWEAGVRLYEGDQVSPEPLSAAAASEARVRRARMVDITVDGKVISRRVTAKRVGEALAQAGVLLQGLDYAIPGLDDELSEGASIRVVRVREDVLVEQSPIPFETVYEPLTDLEIDNKRVLSTGSYGVQASRIRIRIEDGVEVARDVEEAWIAKEPEPRRIGYGTKIVVRTLNTPDGPIQYWRAVEMYATSYSPSRAGIPLDHPWFGITASGKPLKKGLVAIDRSLIPFGTRMYVPGYGFAEAADTGGGVKGRWIDLGYEDDNYVPWAKTVTVYFLTPVPAPENIVWVFP